MSLGTANVGLVVGTGPGLSAAVARQLSAAGVKLALAARDPAKLGNLAAEIGALALRCDVSVADEVEQLFAETGKQLGVPDIVVFNPSARVRGPIAELDPAAVEKALLTTAFGGFLVGRAAARAMLPRASGVIVFTGASASIKGFPGSASFAMGKFALRGLAQSMARELGPKGIHVAHILIDGGILSPANPDPADQPESRLNPDAIAEAYIHVIGQSRSTWTHELDLRPWSEKF